MAGNASLVPIFLGSVVCGALGSMLGLGGGVFIVPFLTLLMHLPFSETVGASIVSVIATSSGAAVAYLRDRITNLRIGMFLEVATTAGALTGAYIEGIVPTSALYIIFGLMLAASAFSMIQKRHEEVPEGIREHPLAARLKLSGQYYDHSLKRMIPYKAAAVYPVLGVSYIAGALSGLLGIGGGLMKVMAMDVFMRLPIKVTSATSNFMIGVTAAASAGLYFVRGDIRLPTAGPVALGVLAGTLIGTRVLVRLRSTGLRRVFVPVLVFLCIEMIGKGIGL